MDCEGFPEDTRRGNIGSRTLQATLGSESEGEVQVHSSPLFILDAFLSYHTFHPLANPACSILKIYPESHSLLSSSRIPPSSCLQDCSSPLTDLPASFHAYVCCPYSAHEPARSYQSSGSWTTPLLCSKCSNEPISPRIKPKVLTRAHEAPHDLASSYLSPHPLPSSL